MITLHEAGYQIASRAKANGYVGSRTRIAVSPEEIVWIKSQTGISLPRRGGGDNWRQVFDGILLFDCENIVIHEDDNDEYETTGEYDYCGNASYAD